MPHDSAGRAGSLREAGQAGGPSVLDAAPYRIGSVSLVVRDLDGLAGFYREALGLATLAQEAGAVRLGTGGAVLLELRHDPAARPGSPREAGLFHTAFLLPDRGDLGAWLAHAAERGLPLSGAADHLVSEAVYLSDPEGNGIEVYADRPETAWPRAEDGTLILRNDPLDQVGLVRAARTPWAGMPAGGRIGHVHLQVGALEPAEHFYVGLLGFDVMCRYPGATFLGAGGYHHQLATNIWNSRGASARPAGLAGLAEIVLLTGAQTLDAVRARSPQPIDPAPRLSAGPGRRFWSRPDQLRSPERVLNIRTKFRTFRLQKVQDPALLTCLGQVLGQVCGLRAPAPFPGQVERQRNLIREPAQPAPR